MHKGDAATASAMCVVTPRSSWLLRYVRSYPGTEDQVCQVRVFLREVLSGCPRADDVVALGSEFAANAVLHSRSGIPGGLFTVRAEVNEGAYLWVAVEDDGGSWQGRPCQVQSGHGLDLVQAIAGQGNWGVTGNGGRRLVWARLAWPGTERLERALISPQLAMPSDAGDDVRAELEKLAAELAARGLQAQLCINSNKLPHLVVHDVGTLMLPRRVYARADWFFWPTAERIAACDDLMTAVDTIARVLRMDGEASGA